MGIQIHRFHDTVAIYVGTGPTVYLTLGEARKVAKGLNKTAADISARRFVNSECGTFALSLGVGAESAQRADKLADKSPAIRARNKRLPRPDQSHKRPDLDSVDLGDGGIHRIT